MQSNACIPVCLSESIGDTYVSLDDVFLQLLFKHLSPALFPPPHASILDHFLHCDFEAVILNAFTASDRVQSLKKSSKHKPNWPVQVNFKHQIYQSSQEKNTSASNNNYN